jgi:hypothetical protein
MADYGVNAFCDICGDVHWTGELVTLADGPSDPRSIGDAYAGRDVPQELEPFLRKTMLCSKEGRAFVQRNIKQIMLVPIDRTVRGMTYGADARIVLDYGSFDDCVFNSTELVYLGGQPPNMTRCTFNNVKWQFEGGAGGTLYFMHCLIQGGLRPVVEGLFQGILQNKVPIEIRKR